MATPEQMAASLTMDEIPVKLRCAACNKLANNAFRTPCCDQSICEDCQASLPQACPVCLHEPVKSDDCRPNKALRTTIKVFLRKKGVERENARKKEMVDRAAAAPATPATPLAVETPAPKPPQTPVEPIPATAPEGNDVKQGSRPASQVPLVSNNLASIAHDSAVPTEAQKDIPQMSIESPGVEITRRASTQTAGDGSVGQEKTDEKEQQSEQQTQQEQVASQNGQWASGNGVGMSNGGFILDTTNGGFTNMGLNGMGDFNQMLQIMPNGMPNTMMGSFPNMMGMPGMGMDPMTMSQGLYGGFGGQGIGMNGMNMGMGFNAGQGAFGGFNGQPAAWNAGQDKFNQNAYGGHAGVGSDFGANTGYGGYNLPPHQGNFNQMHHHQYPNNDFHHGHHSQGFQNRGRGRGRGYLNAGRGRGYNQGLQGNQANHQPFHQQLPPEITRRGSPQYGPQQEQPERKQQDQPSAESQQDGKSEDTTNNLTTEEQLNKELDPGDADDNVEKPSELTPKEEEVEKSTATAVTELNNPDQVETQSVPEKEEKPAPIETFVSDERPEPETPNVESSVDMPSAMKPPPSPIIPTGPAALYTTDQQLDISPRGRGVGRGFHRGGEYRGGPHGRGSGYQPISSFPRIQPTPSAAKLVISPVEPKGLGVEGAPKAPKALREGQQHTVPRGSGGFSIVGRASAAAQARPNGNTATKSPSRERSRSHSRHQSSQHRHHRHRSASPTNESEREKRRDRHHRHSRKHEGENGDAYEVKGSRTREESPDSSAKRSSHRSRRDHEKDRDVERGSHRSHRSHRDRSREPDADHRSGRKRSKSPQITINGASRVNGAIPSPTINRQKEKEDESAQSSRKRRDRDEDDHHRERKRSRRDYEEGVEEKDYSHRSRPSKREEKESRSNHDRAPHAEEKPVEKPVEKPKSPPKGPKIDQHALERQARDRERQAKELQRRALAEGKGVGAKGKDGRVSGKGGRRMSYKYEDELTTSKVESEREALRYR